LEFKRIKGQNREMKTAIVTGSCGYIGSVLCKMLIENEYQTVIGIDKGEQRHPYMTFYRNDFDSDIKHLLDYYPEATVFHLAANSLLGPSHNDPLSYFSNNTVKTLNLIKLLKPTNRLIFASTAAVYAETDEIITENSRLAPPNNYGLSKLFTEQMLDSYCKIGGITAISFRFFNVIGAYGDVGQKRGTPHVVNKLCEAAYDNSEFQIYGNDWDTRDGTCIRDYVNVQDICRAMIHAGDQNVIPQTADHLKYNLGTMTGTSVKELVDVFRGLVKDVGIEYVDRRPGDPAKLIADPAKFINDTNFQYKFNNNDLPEMVYDAWQYFESEGKY